MTKDRLLKKIEKKAIIDEKHRWDTRFLQTMGFLVARGFLKTNQKITSLPNIRVNIENALWAGKNVEPRILEVLPAAILRFPRNFDVDINNYPEIVRAIKKIKLNVDLEEDELYGIPLKKMVPWVNLPLPDRRTKPYDERKEMKTFRFKRSTITLLKSIASHKGISETEVVENLINFSKSNLK
ncbi:MAG: hypothetical protein A3F16_08405 [Deltaproteobacteria bacterium RIFCSPHIGHO2_12_FULL_43_9]|nr:MAG: hypothetical protein A3F16_08405 [Deltaproteobacteria bacterium RIFCSPHIGHO2_12_FULL_43_9]